MGSEVSRTGLGDNALLSCILSAYSSSHCSMVLMCPWFIVGLYLVHLGFKNLISLIATWKVFPSSSEIEDSFLCYVYSRYLMHRCTFSSRIGSMMIHCFVNSFLSPRRACCQSLFLRFSGLSSLPIFSHLSISCFFPGRAVNISITIDLV